MEFWVYALNSYFGSRNSHQDLNMFLAVLEIQTSVYFLFDFRKLWYNPRSFDVKKEKSKSEDLPEMWSNHICFANKI